MFNSNLNHWANSMRNIDKTLMGLSYIDSFRINDSLIDSAIRFQETVSSGTMQLLNLESSLRLGLSHLSKFSEISSSIDQTLRNISIATQSLNPSIINIVYENQYHLQLSKAAIGLTKQIAQLNKLYDPEVFLSAFDNVAIQMEQIYSEIEISETGNDLDNTKLNLLEVLEDAINESGILEKAKSQINEVQIHLQEKILLIYSYVITKYPKTSSITIEAFRSYIISLLISVAIGTSSIISVTNTFNINIENASLITINIHDTKIITKEIKHAVKKLPLDATALSSYRFVIIESLAVRRSPKMESEKIDKIPLGKMVRIVEKRRNWSLIEYMNQDGEYVYGWTHTRYLEKFK